MSWKNTSQLRAIISPGKLGLLIALCIYLLPLSVFNHVPTQDGPLHIDTAAAMLDSLGSHSAFFHNSLEFRFPLETNTLGHYILLLLLALGLSAEHCNAAFQLLYLLCFAGGAAYFLSAIRTAAWVLTPLLLPFAYAYMFHLGFYNNCLSVCGFFWCWGAFLRCVKSPVGKPARKHLLALVYFTFLTWLAHPIGTLAFAFGAIFCGALDLFLLRQVSFIKRLKQLLLPGIISVAALCLDLFFLHGKKNNTLWEFESFSVLGANLLELSAMNSFALANFDFSMLLISIGVSLIFILGIIQAFILWNRKQDKWPLSILLMTLFYLAVYFLAPKEAAGSGYINERLMPFIFFFFVAFLASTKILSRTLSVLGLVALTALHLVHWPHYVQAKRVEADYLFAVREIAPESFVYPMHLASHAWDGDDYATRRADPSVHLAAFYTANNDGIYLNNTIARWREGRQASFRIAVSQGLDNLPAALPGTPAPIDFEKFTQQVGRPVDFVLLYGNFLELGSLASYYEAAIEKSYDCRKVSPLGLVKLCKRK